jgi:hypothetical protein
MMANICIFLRFAYDKGPTVSKITIPQINISTGDDQGEMTAVINRKQQ